MTIHIPEWLLWTLGACIAVPLVMFIGFLAVVGWEMSKIFSSRGFWR